MSEAKFTPGPWTADGMTICGAGTTIDVEGSMVAQVSRAIANDRFTRGLKTSQVDANAHLIAAAPELYGVLETLIKLWAEHEVMSVAFSDAIESGAVALAKAQSEDE